MSNCPYCGTYLSSDPEIPPMSKRRRRIYDTVSAAGPDGISANGIISAVFNSSDTPKSAYGMVRVQICEINKIIWSNGQKITGTPRLGYRLVIAGGSNGQEEA
jgi:hypothetical protein